MNVFIIIVTGFLLYTAVALVLLRFVRFVTACDREIRIMASNEQHPPPALFRSPRKHRKMLRLRPVSS